jgi:hypothetical protein
MDSFRKMQQLRKEFQQARTIIQLMVEREEMQMVRKYLMSFCIISF